MFRDGCIFSKFNLSITSYAAIVMETESLMLREFEREHIKKKVQHVYATCFLTRTLDHS